MQLESLRHFDRWPAPWCVWALFHRFPCINIVVLASSRPICPEFQNTSVELTCENPQLGRCLQHKPAALPPLLAKGLSLKRCASLGARRNQLADGPRSTPGVIRVEKQYFTCVISGLYAIWKQPNLGWEWSTGTLLMAERRPDFLKGPLLVSLQNSGASGLVSMQFTTLDFPREEIFCMQGREGRKKKKKKKKIFSFKFKKHCRVLPDFSTVRSPTFSTWGKVSVRDERGSKVYSLT